MRFEPYNQEKDMIEAEKPSLFKNLNNGRSMYRDWWDSVSNEVKELCLRDKRISLNEYENMRGNSYDWKTITPILSNEALISKTENSLRNIFGKNSSMIACSSFFIFFT